MNIKLLALASLLLTTRLAVGEIVFELKFANDTVTDTVSGQPLKVHNVVVMEAAGKGYGEFDGKSVVEAEHNPNLSFLAGDVFWAEMWIEPLKVVKPVSLLSKGTGANYRITIQNDGSFAFTYYSRGEWRSTMSPADVVPNETWTHLACYFDPTSGQAVLFVNGTVVGLSQNLPPFQSNQDLPLYIGGQPVKEAADTYTGFNGAIGSILLAKIPRFEMPATFELGSKVFSVEPAY